MRVTRISVAAGLFSQAVGIGCPRFFVACGRRVTPDQKAIIMLPSDNLVPLSQAAALVPTRPHYNTLRRWILRGSRGRKLDAQLIAGRWFTTPQAVTNFLETPPNKIVVGRHATRQQTAAHRAAVQEADRLGI